MEQIIQVRTMGIKFEIDIFYLFLETTILGYVK